MDLVCGQSPRRSPKTQIVQLLAIPYLQYLIFFSMSLLAFFAKLIGYLLAGGFTLAPFFKWDQDSLLGKRLARYSVRAVIAGIILAIFGDWVNSQDQEKKHLQIIAKADT